MMEANNSSSMELSDLGLYRLPIGTAYEHKQTREQMTIVQDFHMNYVLVPADKAANNIVVVCRLYYIDTLKQTLLGTNAYKLP